MVKNEATAVFFPGELDPQENEYNLRYLKNALIYFDRILSIVPETIFTGYIYSRINSYEARSARVRRFVSETKSLEGKGILKLVNPQENINHYYVENFPKVAIKKTVDIDKNYPKLLFKGIVSDIEDPVFRTIVDNLNMGPMPLFPDQLESSWYRTIQSHYRKDLWAYRPDNDLEYIMASPQLGAALLLNHALITAIRYNAIPVANSIEFDYLLRRKFERIIKMPEIQDSLRVLKRNTGWNTDFLATKVLNVSLPEFDIKTFDDILELREKLSEQLEGFRSYLAEASSLIQDAAVGEIYSVADNLVKNKIAPALSEIERKLRLSNDKFLLRVIKGFRSAKATIPLIGSVITGIPLWLGFALSAGATITEAVLDTYFEKREIRENNSLSFLIGIKKVC